MMCLMSSAHTLSHAQSIRAEPQRVMGISDLSMGSPAQTGLTYQTQCQGSAAGYESFKHLGTPIKLFYDQTPDCGTFVQLTCDARCSSGEISTYTGRLAC